MQEAENLMSQCTDLKLTNDLLYIVIILNIEFKVQSTFACEMSHKIKRVEFYKYLYYLDTKVSNQLKIHMLYNVFGLVAHC